MASTSIPKLVKGILVERVGGVDVMQYKSNIPVPVRKDVEVLIEITSIA
jgi:NADPH2:quinone reductase